MKKGEIYEGIIEKVEFPNKGFVWVDDQKVIVKNGIPGQKVRFMINKKRSGRRKDVFWRSWRNLPWKQENLPVRSFRHVAAACTRP